MTPSPRPGQAPLRHPARRTQLLARSAALRVQFTHEARALEAPLARVDRVRDGLRWLRGHPAWLVGGVLLLAVLRPRQLGRWAARAWWVWQWVQHPGALARFLTR